MERQQKSSYLKKLGIFKAKLSKKKPNWFTTLLTASIRWLIPLINSYLGFRRGLNNSTTSALPQGTQPSKKSEILGSIRFLEITSTNT